MQLGPGRPSRPADRGTRTALSQAGPRCAAGCRWAWPRDFGHDRVPGDHGSNWTPGTTLLLCTDGLVEQPGADLAEGIDALPAAVRTGPTDLQALADRLSDVCGTIGAARTTWRCCCCAGARPGGTTPRRRPHSSSTSAGRPGGPAPRPATCLGQRCAAGAPERADEIELAADELIANALTAHRRRRDRHHGGAARHPAPDPAGGRGPLQPLAAAAQPGRDRHVGPGADAGRGAWPTSGAWSRAARERRVVRVRGAGHDGSRALNCCAGQATWPQPQLTEGRPPTLGPPEGRTVIGGRGHPAPRAAPDHKGPSRPTWPLDDSA